MRFSLQREVLLKPLAQVVNVVERRHTLPVLANLLVRVLAGRIFARPRARTLGLVFGNRNISLMLAALPPDPTFSLFVAMAQIPIYASPIILRGLDGSGVDDEARA